MEPAEIARRIEAGFDNATVRILTDDNIHFQAVIVAGEFEGMRKVSRHQRVYRCLGELVGNEIHAISIRALTPAEWRAEAEG